MHANDKVLAFTEDQKGYVKEVTEVFHKPLLPFHCKNPQHYPFKLQKWLLESRASLNREDINTLVSFYGKEYITPPNFVSLLNSYWIHTEKNYMDTWDSVNPYDHWTPEEDIINILVHYPSLIEQNFPFNFNSPNMTLPGTKERYWYKENGEFFILEKKTKKTDYPMIIYEEQLFVKKRIPYIGKKYEFLPLSLYTEALEGENVTELFRLQQIAERYKLDKTKIRIGHISETFVIRDVKTLYVIDTLIL